MKEGREGGREGWREMEGGKKGGGVHVLTTCCNDYESCPGDKMRAG